MAVYRWNITNAEVLNTVGFSPAAANADPTTAQIDVWIQQFCGRVVNVMFGLGVTAADITTMSDDALYQECRGVITGRVAAAWYIANQRDLGDYPQYLIDGFDAFLEHLRIRPGFVTGETGHAMLPRYGSRTARTYVDTVDPEQQSAWLTKSDGFN